MNEASENPTRRRSRRWGLTVGAVVGAGALAVGGIAVASIPAQGSVIHGCYNNTNGGLRVVDDSTTTSCKTHETAIQWNQTGPQGLQGPQGLPGPAGPEGPAAASLWVVVEFLIDASGGEVLTYHGSGHFVTLKGRGTTYTLAFDRDVSSCAYTATGRDRDWDVVAAAEPAAGDPRSVVVTMRQLSDAHAVRAAFSLVVTC